jgi:hypothetical protein
MPCTGGRNDESSKGVRTPIEAQELIRNEKGYTATVFVTESI